MQGRVLNLSHREASKQVKATDPTRDLRTALVKGPMADALRAERRVEQGLCIASDGPRLTEK
jgi:hypothetical protein